MNPKRISVKFFTTEPEAGVDLAPFIPLFHRAIQQAALPGLLVDVADYIHVPNGPGVVLVGHDVDYGIDSVGGQTGLLTVRKRAGDESLEALLEDALRRALFAIRYIEEDGSGKIRFATDGVEVAVLDRLTAGNDEAGYEAARGAVERVATKLYGDGATTAREADQDPRKALAFQVRSAQATDAKTLLDRLGATAEDVVAEEGAAATPAGAIPDHVPGPQVPGQSEWDLSPEQLKHLIDTSADFVLVDVREPREFEICEIGGKLIPLGELAHRMEELSPSDHIVVHCHVGGRSAAAVNALREAGFENVWNLQGGIRAWIQRIDSSLADY